MARFARPAFASKALWRIFLVLALFEAALWLTPSIAAYLWPEAAMRPLDTLADGGIIGPWDTAGAFMMYIVTLVLFVIAVRIIHGRNLPTLVGPAAYAIRHYWLALAAVLAALVISTLAPPLLPLGGDDDLMRRDILGWLRFLPLALVAITIQSACEEIVYRGYLQQQMAAWSSNPIVWLGIPATIFGVAHLANGAAMSEGISWAVWATALGLACGDLTARTGNLGAAVGLHSANNIFAVVIFGVEGDASSGLSLFIYQDSGASVAIIEPFLSTVSLTELAVSLVMVLVMWLAARVVLKV